MAAPWDGRLATFLGYGDVSDRPATPNTAPGMLCIWFDTVSSSFAFYESVAATWTDYPTPLTVETTQDLVAAMLVAGTNMTVTYNDGAGTVTFDGKTDEQIEDLISTFLTAGANIQIDYDDAGNVLEISVTGSLGATVLADLTDVDVTTTPPTDQQALIWDDATNLWIPGDVSGGGGGGSTPWYWNPPEAGDFTLISGDANNLTLADDTDVGLTIDLNTPTSSRVYRGAYQAIPTPASPWELIARIPWGTVPNGTAGLGISCRDSVGGKFTSFGFLSNNLLGLYIQTNFTTFAGTVLESAVMAGFNSASVFLRMTYDGTTIKTYVGVDGKLWSLWSSFTRSAQLANHPDQIGLVNLYFSSTNTVPSGKGVCDMFTFTQ